MHANQFDYRPCQACNKGPSCANCRFQACLEQGFKIETTLRNYEELSEEPQVRQVILNEPESSYINGNGQGILNMRQRLALLDNGATAYTSPHDVHRIKIESPEAPNSPPLAGLGLPAQNQSHNQSQRSDQNALAALGSTLAEQIAKNLAKELNNQGSAFPTPEIRRLVQNARKVSTELPEINMQPVSVAEVGERELEVDLEASANQRTKQESPEAAVTAVKNTETNPAAGPETETEAENQAQARAQVDEVDEEVELGADAGSKALAIVGRKKVKTEVNSRDSDDLQHSLGSSPYSTVAVNENSPLDEESKAMTDRLIEAMHCGEQIPKEEINQLSEMFE